jgi:hypothetical protein
LPGGAPTLVAGRHVGARPDSNRKGIGMALLGGSE